MNKYFPLAIVVIAALFIPLSYFKAIPKELKNVPRADKIGMVLDIKKIIINNIENPINSSIIESNEKDYLVAFRFREEFDSSDNYIGIALLDENFNQIGEYKKIDVNSSKAEDPRIYKHKNDFFLIYNDTMPIAHYARAMYIAKLNPEFTPEYITCLDQHIKPVEKNWVPFSYNTIKGEKLLLAYGLTPHKIMEVTDTTKNSIEHYIYKDNPSYSRFFWKWGEPRGGTPARLVDGEYLAFFHSCFGTGKKKWYVMGAYTYEAHPPFKITKVSKFPIIFDNVRATRVFFPTGFIHKKTDGKELIILSYGENDEFSKIVTLDKEKLFENMKAVY